MIRDATPASDVGEQDEPAGTEDGGGMEDHVDWNTLPPEIIAMICDEWLDLEDLYFCRLVSKGWALAASHALVHGVADLVVGDGQGAALVDAIDRIKDAALERAGLMNPLPFYSIGRLLKEAGVSRGSIAFLEAVETFSFTDVSDIGRLLKGLGCESRHIRAILDNVDRSEWTTAECSDLLRETGLETMELIQCVTSMENVTTPFRWGVIAELENWWDGWDSDAGPEAPENAKATAGLKKMLADETIAGQDEDRRCQEIGEILREWENGAIVAVLPIITDVSWANKGRLASATFGWGEDYLRGAFDILGRFQTGAHLHAFGPTTASERCEFFSGLADRYGGLHYMLRGFFLDPVWPPTQPLQITDFIIDPHLAFLPSTLSGIIQDSRPFDHARLAGFLETVPKLEDLCVQAFSARHRTDRDIRISSLLSRIEIPARALAKITWARENEQFHSSGTESGFRWHPKGDRLAAEEAGELVAWVFIDQVQKRGSDFLRRVGRIRDGLLSAKFPDTADREGKPKAYLEFLDRLGNSFLETLLSSTTKRATAPNRALAYLGLLVDPLSRPGKRYFVSSDLLALIADKKTKLTTRIETPNDARSVLLGLAVGAGDSEVGEIEKISAWKVVGHEHEMGEQLAGPARRKFLGSLDELELTKGKHVLRSPKQRKESLAWGGEEAEELLLELVVAQTRVSKKIARETFKKCGSDVLKTISTLTRSY